MLVYPPLNHWHKKNTIAISRAPTQLRMVKREEDGLFLVYLDMDGALADVEVEAADGFGGVPLPLPVEFSGNLPPEARGILNGLLVHLFILHTQETLQSMTPSQS